MEQKTLLFTALRTIPACKAGV